MVRSGLVFMLTLSAVASADDKTALERARKAVEASDYSGARSLLDEALRSGGNGPDHMIELYRLSGIAAAATGDEAAAVDAFTRLLALSPKSVLPQGTSPKITRPFAKAGSYFKSHEPLHVKLETSAQPPLVTLAIESDPLSMIAGAQVSLRVDGKAAKQLEGKGTGKIEIELPHGDKLELQVVAIDEHGNHLVELGTKDIPIVITDAREHKTPPPPPPPNRPPPPARPRPWYLAWWAWGTGAIVLAGAASAFGADALEASAEVREIHDLSYLHYYQEELDAKAHAQRSALIANIGFGAAGALAIGATILFLTRPHAPTLAAVPLRGGAAVVLEGSL